MAKMKRANPMAEMVWMVVWRYKGRDPEMAFFEEEMDARHNCESLEFANELAYCFLARVYQQLADKQGAA